MASTRGFVQESVGEHGTNKTTDVRRLQTLLISAGFGVRGGADGKWGEGTKAALAAAARTLPAGSFKPAAPVKHGDYLLLYLVWKAGLLIQLPGKAGMAGVLWMHRWFVEQGVRYNLGAEKGRGNRAVWGVHEDLRYAVQTIGGSFGRGPIEMDCTTYVNLMLSIYASGHCHHEPYAASCAAFGGTAASHCARDRYGMALVERARPGAAAARHFETAAQLREATAAQEDKLYAIEVAEAGSGFVRHMALLHDATVYECTTGQAGSACISRSVEAFCAAKKDRIYYLFGPHLATR